jgi:hypothetical protein
VCLRGEGWEGLGRGKGEVNTLAFYVLENMLTVTVTVMVMDDWVSEWINWR